MLFLPGQKQHPFSFHFSTFKLLLRFSSVQIVAASATPEASFLIETFPNAYAASSSFVAVEPWLHCTIHSSFGSTGLSFEDAIALNIKTITCISPTLVHPLEHKFTILDLIFETFTTLSHLHHTLRVLTANHHVTHQPFVLV
jgi:hypothetical protein